MWHPLLVFLTLMPHIFAVNPGIKAILTDKGLHYGSHVGTSWLLQKITSMSIPDVEGDIGIGALGSVHYWLSSMRVSQFNLPEPTVSFSKDLGIKVGMEHLNIAVHGNWRTKYYFIHDGGSFDLAVLNVDLSTLLQLGSDEHGHPSVANPQCDSSIQGIHISFHGGASFIFQPFVDHFKGEILTQIQKKICPMINNTVSDLESQLAKMQVSLKVNENLLLEIPLVLSPIIQSSDLELDLKGLFYSTKNHTEPPFIAAPFELIQQSGLMLTIGLSEFTVNTAFYAYFSAGLLQAYITDNMIPKVSPIRLNTTSFGTLIPQLPKLFPNMLMELQVYATKTPTISFQPDIVTLNISASSKAYGIQPNSTLTPFFRLDMNAFFSSKFFIAKEKLMGSLTLENFTLTLGTTEIGTFQTKALQNLLVSGIKVILLPQINTKLKNGIPLPITHNVQFVNPILKVNKGLVAIATDTKIFLQDNKNY